MASPQCENGYTKIANEILEQLISQRLPGEQLRVLLCIIRASYGWNEKSVSITHQEIADQTNISRPSVSRAISSLVTKKLLTCNKKVTKNCNELIFNKNYEDWENRPKRKTCNKKVTKVGYKKVTQKPVAPITRKKGKETPISPKQKKSKYTPPSGDELKKQHPWLSASTWDEWVAFRSEISKPLKSDRGVNQQIKFLSKFQNQHIEIIERSIRNEWQGLFEPKGNGNGSHRHQSRVDRNNAALQKALHDIGADEYRENDEDNGCIDVTGGATKTRLIR